MTSAGFVGLGNIGNPMASQVAKRFDTYVFDLLPEAVARLEAAGAKGSRDCSELASHCDVIGVCVLNDAGTRSVVTGDKGLLEGAKPGSVIALHGTIHPDTVLEVAELALKQEVFVIDAQVTGGAAGAEKGTLTTMVGGPAEAIDKARPYFESFSAQVTHCGPLGTGAVAKLCNNLVQFQTWHAMTEASRLANASGIEHETLMEVLSWTLSDGARATLAVRNLLLAQPEHPEMRQRFEEVLGLAEKDLSLALEVARDSEVALPGTELCLNKMPEVLGLRAEGK